MREIRVFYERILIFGMEENPSGRRIQLTVVKNAEFPSNGKRGNHFG
jgi:hypothetical protein